MEIKQDRQQFYHKPNGSIKHIRSWELLCQTAIQHKFRERFDDRSINGVRHCIVSWFIMYDVPYQQKGTVVIVGDYAIEVTGTHRVAPRPAIYRGPLVHVTIESLWDFHCWYDTVFTIDF